MRHSAGRLNRTWLAVVGLVLTLAAVAWLLVATGLLAGLLPAGLRTPEPSGPAAQVDPAVVAGSPVLPGILIAAGAVLVILALAWLAAQVPKRHQAGRYRIQQDAATGMTTLNPDVLQEAVNAEAEGIPDVLRARSVLRGSAGAPDLTMKVTISPRAQTQRVLATIEHDVATHLASSLGAPLARLAIEVDVDNRTRKTSTVTL
ncbi:hypothetical protein GCM10027403_15430 [Arthrobacter tecti]